MNEEKVLTNKITAYSGGLAFLFGIAAMLVAEMIMVLAIREENALQTTFAYLSQTLFFASALFVATLQAKREGATSPLKTAFRYLGVCKAKPLCLLFAFLSALAAIIAFLPLATGVEWLFAKMGYSQTPSYADYTSSIGVYLAVGVLGLSVFPAFGEEFMMRGALARGLREKGTLFALFISALSFAAMHGSPTQFIHQFLIGVIMAYFVLVGDSIWYSVIFHFTNNFVVVTYNYVYLNTGAEYVIPFYIYIIMFAVGVVALAFTIYLFVKFALPKEERSGSPFRLIGKALRLSPDGYAKYRSNPCYSLYIALALVGILFIINTISGWTA